MLLSPLDLYSIRDHLVEVRLPQIAVKSPTVKAFYQPVLEGPASAIEACRSYVAPWMTELFEAATVREEREEREVHADTASLPASITSPCN